MTTDLHHIMTTLNMAGLSASPAPNGRGAVRYATPVAAGTVTCRPDLRLVCRQLREAGYWGWLPVPMTGSDWARKRKAERLA
jgi:hypothetical protein